MQTFLPYSSFIESARCLDYRRLGKQRVEARQILNALHRTTGGWVNHPAVRMWRGHEGSLVLYSNCMIAEWIRRGFKNSMPLLVPHEPIIPPPWLGNESFHLSHRSNLVRKEPKFYGKQWPDVSPDLPYVWPV